MKNLFLGIFAGMIIASAGMVTFRSLAQVADVIETVSKGDPQVAKDYAVSVSSDVYALTEGKLDFVRDQLTLIQNICAKNSR